MIWIVGSAIWRRSRLSILITPSWLLVCSIDLGGRLYDTQNRLFLTIRCERIHHTKDNIDKYAADRIWLVSHQRRGSRPPGPKPHIERTAHVHGNIEDLHLDSQMKKANWMIRGLYITD